jgi:hypothetical protein
MKLTFNTFGFVVALALGGCVGSDHQSHVGKDGGVAPIARREVGGQLETIQYSWEGYGVEVSFCKRDGEPSWGMTMRDSADIYEQFEEPGRVWGPSASRCSREECLKLIDGSMKRFHTEKPDARLEYVAVEMQIVRELWSELLTGLGQKLSAMDGYKSDQPGDIPPEFYNELQAVLTKSTTVAQIKTLLKTHGLNVCDIGIANQLLFKTSLNGQKWSSIAASPGMGIEMPGVVEFDIGKSRTGAALGKGMNDLTISKSP